MLPKFSWIKLSCALVVQLTSTSRARLLSLSSGVLVLAGILRESPSVVAYGAALLSGVAAARALTLISIARARASGFEMSWLTGERSQRATRSIETSLRAELRNRDTSPTRFRDLEVTHSPHLRVTVTPESGTIPAGGRLEITLTITPERVGFHGIHGIVLETIRAPGLHTVPLGFTSPFVLAVLPRPAELLWYGAFRRRGRAGAPEASPSHLAGEGAEFRELRDHRPGDPFKRIAWKASARRGRLLTVEKDSEDRSLVWLVLDGSVDAWTGPSGAAPMDGTIDDATALVRQHLGRGDGVGLCLVGARHVTEVPLGHGPAHEARLLAALAFEAHTGHADCSEWDETDALEHALEHARSLDPAAHAALTNREGALDLVRHLLESAPVLAPTPDGNGPSDALVRRYLLSFGIQPPARGISDRFAVERHMGQVLTTLGRRRPRPAIVYVLGRPPTLETPRDFFDGLGLCRRRSIEVRFLPEMPTLSEPGGSASPKRRLAHAALETRLDLSLEVGRKNLLGLGVRIVSRRGPRAWKGQGLRTTIARSRVS